MACDHITRTNAIHEHNQNHDSLKQISQYVNLFGPVSLTSKSTKAHFIFKTLVRHRKKTMT